MNRNEIIEKLKAKKGYLKKGVDWLAKSWGISPKLLKECKKEIAAEEYQQHKKTTQEFTNENVNEIYDNGFKQHLSQIGLKLEDVKSVKFWQTSKGDSRYSVVPLNKWHELDSEKNAFLEQVKKKSPKVSKYSYKPKTSASLGVLSLPDIHYGKITGEGPEAIEEHYMKVVMELWEKAKGSNIEQLLMPIGNDGMNSEGLSKATTAGTPQDDYMGWRQSFRGYWQLMDTAITWLSERVPVKVVIVQGNHDFERMFYIGELLESRYANNPNIDVDNSLDERKYYQYGSNMFLNFHGDKVKRQNIPLLMATEEPLMWSNTKFREALVGHIHKELVDEIMGTKVRHIPSICGNDEWHKGRAYVGTQRVGQMHIYHFERGYEGMFQINIID